MKELTKHCIDNYHKNRVPPGHFLLGVLENNLTEAIRRADDENLRDLAEILTYIWNKLPSNIWGSPEAVNRHLEDPTDCLPTAVSKAAILAEAVTHSRDQSTHVYEQNKQKVLEYRAGCKHATYFTNSVCMRCGLHKDKTPEEQQAEEDQMLKDAMHI